MNLLVTLVDLVRLWLVTIVLYRVEVKVLFALRTTHGNPLRVSLTPLVILAEVSVIQPMTPLLLRLTFPSIMPPVFNLSRVLSSLPIAVLLTLRLGQLCPARTSVLARPGTNMLVLLVSVFTVLYSLGAHAGHTLLVLFTIGLIRCSVPGHLWQRCRTTVIRLGELRKFEHMLLSLMLLPR